jgi:hypothetical protein
MLSVIFRSTLRIFSSIFGSFFPKKITKENTPRMSKAIQIANSPKSIETFKDKVLFQPNTLHSSESIECPVQPPKNEGNPQEETSSIHNRISLECNEAIINHIEGLCRFFEVSKTDALARGVWLLSIARDVEMADKKLGVITTDKNGMVIDVAPINIV